MNQSVARKNNSFLNQKPWTQLTWSYLEDSKKEYHNVLYEPQKKQWYVDNIDTDNKAILRSDSKVILRLHRLHYTYVSPNFSLSEFPPTHLNLLILLSIEQGNGMAIGQNEWRHSGIERFETFQLPNLRVKQMKI